MVCKPTMRSSVMLSGLLLAIVILSFSGPGNAGDPGNAFYSPDYTKIMWFIQASDMHIGTSGTKDSTNLNWLVTQARQYVAPSFMIVTGDLTDSTNGNFFGIPNGPYQEEWNQYKSILSAAGITPETAGDFYYDIPGNHDAYNDGGFSYYLANSIQGRATGNAQVSFNKSLPSGETYHFLGLNTAGSGLPFSLIRPWGDDAGLSPDELAFIEQEMASKSPGAQLSVVFGHHPLFDTGDSDDTWVGPGLSEFLGLMDTYWGAFYGYGHTHVSREQFFVPSSNAYPGFYYFNVAALGKDSPNEYGITAIDNNGIASRTFTVGAWPAVLITAPLDAQFGTANPYAYPVPASAENFIRALVFDNPQAQLTVRYRIDGSSTWYGMTTTPNDRVYQASWDASQLSEGTHTVEVQAASSSGTRSDIIAVQVARPAASPIGAAVTDTGKYSRKTFTSTSIFKPGDKIVFRMELRDSNNLLLPLSNATVQLAIRNSSGDVIATLTSGPSNAGKAEATWATKAPSKRGGAGTPPDTYTATIADVTATGFLHNAALDTARSFAVQK